MHLHELGARFGVVAGGGGWCYVTTNFSFLSVSICACAFSTRLVSFLRVTHLTLRQLVGSSYRDAIASADTIMDLETSAGAVVANLTGVCDVLTRLPQVIAHFKAKGTVAQLAGRAAVGLELYKLNAVRPGLYRLNAVRPVA
jgi:hypothetical protein